MEKRFFIREDKSLEMAEVANILKAKGFDVETLKCSKDDVKQFFADLQKLVENGVTPVLVGRKCQDKDGSFFNLSTKVPDGVVLLLETAKDKPLLSQVAKMIDVHLTSSQKLKGLMNKLSFAELRNKGYAAKEIIACFDKQYLLQGGKQADIFDLRQAVESHSGTFPLVEVTIPMEKLLGLLPNLVEKKPYQIAGLNALLTGAGKFLFKLSSGKPAAIPNAAAIAEAQGDGRPLWEGSRTKVERVSSVCREVWEAMADQMELGVRSTSQDQEKA